VIEIEHVSKSYGSLSAVDDVSFQVDKGNVVGFLGPNGAGKSTTLRILAGFLAATSGRVRIGGHDVVEERQRALSLLGYMPETSPLYPELRVAEYLRFRSELKGIPRQRRKAEVERALERARVSEMATVVIGHLSKGYRQRVGLADALLGSPPLLILDEPTAGLDPNQIRDVRALIGALGQEHTVLLSTHILPEVEAICDRAIVIHRGRLVAQGPIDELKARRGRLLELGVAKERDRALEVLRADAAVSRAELRSEGAPGAGSQRVEVDPEVRVVEVELSDDSADPLGVVTERLVFALAAAGIGLRHVMPVSASLEQVFSELTRDETARAKDEPPAKAKRRKRT
jgi:ABC-2 type transport system ATP-binding protein